MVPSLDQINEAERPFLGPAGEPVLYRSLALLRKRWAAGCRDRETALRLLFVCWYANIEPPFLTGISEIPDLQTLCSGAYAALGGRQSGDPEVCFAVSLMVELGPWCLGDSSYWEGNAPPLGSKKYSQYLKLEQFVGRGAYGEYFASMLSPRKLWGGS